MPIAIFSEQSYLIYEKYFGRNVPQRHRVRREREEEEREEVLTNDLGLL